MANPKNMTNTTGSAWRTRAAYHLSNTASPAADVRAATDEALQLLGVGATDGEASAEDYGTEDTCAECGAILAGMFAGPLCCACENGFDVADDADDDDETHDDTTEAR